MTEALAIVHPTTAVSDSRTLEARDITEALAVAKVAAGSKIFKHIVSPEAAFVIIATGRELGMTAMQSLRGIHMIEGRPCMSADMAMAVVLHCPMCVFFRLVDSSDRIATYETQRVGQPSQRMSFSMEQAQAAGLANKDNWRKFPAAMLRARAGMALARAVYPDALMGIYDPDEMGGGTAQPPAPWAEPSSKRRGEPREPPAAVVVVEGPTEPPIVDAPAAAADDLPADHTSGTPDSVRSWWTLQIKSAPTLDAVERIGMELRQLGPEMARNTSYELFRELWAVMVDRRKAMKETSP